MLLNIGIIDYVKAGRFDLRTCSFIQIFLVNAVLECKMVMSVYEIYKSLIPGVLTRARQLIKTVKYSCASVLG